MAAETILRRLAVYVPEASPYGSNIERSKRLHGLARGEISPAPPREQAILEGIDDLRSEIAFVLSLIDGQRGALDDQEHQLEEMMECLDGFRSEFERGVIRVSELDNISHPDVSPIRSALDSLLTGDVSGRGNTRALCRCVNFWLEDIQRRCYTLIHVMVGAMPETELE